MHLGPFEIRVIFFYSRVLRLNGKSNKSDPNKASLQKQLLSDVINALNSVYSYRYLLGAEFKMVGKATVRGLLLPIFACGKW